MIETSPNTRVRTAYQTAHRARGEAFVQMIRFFWPGR